VNLGAINKHPKLKATPGRAVLGAQASRTCTKTLLSSSLLHRINADELPASTFVFKLNDAVNQRKQRIVLTAADIVARLPLRTALACDDVAAEHSLAAKFFQTQALRLRVATIT
jgi:hypothetical protein